MTITARGLSIVRGGINVISDVRFSVSSGAFLVVLGRNGAGKSSLLHALSGELQPAGGEIAFDGVNIRQWSPVTLAMRRSFLAQQTDCRLPFLAGEIVRLGAEAAGQRGAGARRLVASALEEAGVEHLAERAMWQLSGGEQQRVHWARILAQVNGKPQGHCLFLDEPISSLDIAHQHELLQKAANLARRGATIIAVLHDLNLASRYADQLMLLHETRLLAFGPPSEVLTSARLREVFGITTHVMPHPIDGTPLILVGPTTFGTEIRTDSAQTALQTLC